MSGALAAAAALALALSACEKIEYLPPDPLAGWPTKVLMHRGGGADGPYRDNTLDAVLYGASVLDGVEVDVQISKDGTLWLGHDNEVHACDDVTVVGCFQDLLDSEIEPHATCGGTEHYSRLDEVFAAVKLVYPETLYSLDVKGQYCRALGVDEARAMADEVARLVAANGLDGKVMVESSQREFLERIVASATPVPSFVVALDDIDGPLSASANLGATGISFKYGVEPLDAGVVAGIHRVGKRIVVWTIDAPEDIAAVWAAQPDVVQTDEPDFMSYTGGAAPAQAGTK
ncbi:MAG TPA: glycerophosphodiester phosphodiesterase [Anaeromyxobacter sp.]|nr:glycerophosphodiester phosphodiesterase [Anaeromyxobacter sp.]